MFNKNDPLIGAVQGVIKENDRRREAQSALLETLEIQSEKVLTREQKPLYESLLAYIIEDALENPNIPIKEIIEARVSPNYVATDDGTGPKTKTGKSEKLALTKVLKKAMETQKISPKWQGFGSSNRRSYQPLEDNEKLVIDKKGRLGKNNPNAKKYYRGRSWEKRARTLNPQWVHLDDAQRKDYYIRAKRVFKEENLQEKNIITKWFNSKFPKTKAAYEDYKKMKEKIYKDMYNEKMAEKALKNMKEENLQELSRELLGKYLRKANRRQATEIPNSQKIRIHQSKRAANIELALNKLTNKESSKTSGKPTYGRFGDGTATKLPYQWPNKRARVLAKEENDE